MLVRACSPALLLTGPFSPTTSNLLQEEICFQLPSTAAAPLSQSEAPWSYSCSLGHHHGSDAPPSLRLGMVHKAQRRRHQSSLPNFRHSLGFYRDPLGSPCSSTSRTRWHLSSPSAAAQARLSRTVAVSRAVLAEIPFSSHLIPDGSQHRLAAAQPCPPPPSTAFKHHHHHLTIPQPVAGVPGIRPRVYPAQTSCTPRRPPCSQTHTRTHTRAKAKSTRLLHPHTRSEPSITP